MAQYSVSRGKHYNLNMNRDIHEVVMIADEDGNIINTFGAASNVIISAGDLAGYSSIHKFGAVPSMSQNQSGSIWDVDDTNYPWSAFADATVLQVQAANASDNGKVITIQGLDAAFEPIEEDVSVNTSTVETTQAFKRVYRAFIKTGETNVGDIVVDAKLTTTTVLQINAGKGQTLMAIYTVPAGKTGYLMQGTATCRASADATIDMYVRYGDDTAYRIGHSAEVSGAGGQYYYPFPVPLKIPEKSDIDVRAAVRSNNARVTAAFDIILVDN